MNKNKKAAMGVAGIVIAAALVVYAAPAAAKDKGHEHGGEKKAAAAEHAHDHGDKAKGAADHAKDHGDKAKDTAASAAKSASGGATFDAGMRPILADYLAILKALSSDSTDGVAKAAAAISDRAAKLDTRSVEGDHAMHYAQITKDLQVGAESLAVAPTLESARESMKVLSRPMAMWATMSEPQDINIVYCSMAAGSWVQKRGEISNPYYGSSMLTCGEVIGGPDFAGKAPEQASKAADKGHGGDGHDHGGGGHDH